MPAAKPIVATAGTPFAEWLGEQMRIDGRSLHAISRASGVSAPTLNRALTFPDGAPFPLTVRRLATFFGAPPDVIVQLADPDSRSRLLPLQRLDAFAVWLEERLIAEQGRSLREIASEAGIDEATLYGFRRGKRPSEQSARGLAAAFGEDAEAISALAGRPLLNAAVLSPAGFGRLRDWLHAALGARRMSPERAAREAGLGEGMLRPVLNGGGISRRNLRGLADYFGVDRSELMRLRPIPQGHVEAGRRVAARMSPEAKARFAALARSGEPGRKGYAALIEHLGPGHLRRINKLSAAKVRNGDWAPCQFCQDPQRLIYRSAADARRYPMRFHAGCFDQWAESKPERERRQLYLALGRIKYRVVAYGDHALQERVARQIDAETARLKQPSRRGRPPTLLANLDLALAAATASECGMTAGEIASAIGWSLDEDARQNLTGGKWTRELIKLGRALQHDLPRDAKGRLLAANAGT